MNNDTIFDKRVKQMLIPITLSGLIIDKRMYWLRGLSLLSKGMRQKERDIFNNGCSTTMIGINGNVASTFNSLMSYGLEGCFIV